MTPRVRKRGQGRGRSSGKEENAVIGPCSGTAVGQSPGETGVSKADSGIFLDFDHSIQQDVSSTDTGVCGVSVVKDGLDDDVDMSVTKDPCLCDEGHVAVVVSLLKDGLQECRAATDVSVSEERFEDAISGDSDNSVVGPGTSGNTGRMAKGNKLKLTIDVDKTTDFLPDDVTQLISPDHIYIQDWATAMDAYDVWRDPIPRWYQ